MLVPDPQDQACKLHGHTSHPTTQLYSWLAWYAALCFVNTRLALCASLHGICSADLLYHATVCQFKTGDAHISKALSCK